MFFFRRFVMIFVIVLLPGQRNVQIVTQLWSTLYIMSHTAYVMPYKEPIQNYQEVLNEITVLISSYHLFCFTEWIYDFERRFELGWSLIGVILFNVLVNVTILVFYVCNSIYKKLHRMKLERIKASIMYKFKVRQARKEARNFIKLEQ